MAINKHNKEATQKKGKYCHIREKWKIISMNRSTVLKMNHLEILNINNVLDVVQNRGVLWPAEDEN